MAVFSEHTFYQSIIKTLPKVFLHANYTTENNTIKLTSSMPLRIVFLIAFYLLSAVLLFSGIAKIIDPLPLLNTLKQITFIPTELQIIITTLLSVVEIGLAVLMVMCKSIPLGKIKPPVSAQRFSSEAGKITLTTVTILFASFLDFSIPEKA